MVREATLTFLCNEQRAFAFQEVKICDELSRMGETNSLCIFLYQRDKDLDFFRFDCEIFVISICQILGVAPGN